MENNATGEIEAWYTAEQLRLCLVAMNGARPALLTDDAAGVGVEES